MVAIRVLHAAQDVTRQFIYERALLLGRHMFDGLNITRETCLKFMQRMQESHLLDNATAVHLQ